MIYEKLKKTHYLFYYKKKKHKPEDEYCTLVRPLPEEIQVKEGEDIKISCNIIGIE